MRSDGFTNYREFFTSPPLLSIEWHDQETEAVGWLVINSLRNGAAGGGTRMRVGATRSECVFLAKTMEVKFRVSGPPIGGAKSVINFDPQDPRKRGVLERWYRSVAPFLKLCYGTGGDLDVNEIEEVMPITRQHAGITHPQEGIVRGYVNCSEPQREEILQQLNIGVALPLSFPDLPSDRFTVADMVTGYGLMRSLHYFYEMRNDSLKGKRVMIEGFGAVGGSAAYYLADSGAHVVGIVTKGGQNSGTPFRSQINDNGLPIADLLIARDGNNLPVGSNESADAREFWDMQADIFIPAAASHLLSQRVLDELHLSGVKVIACGANNPFSIDWKYENIEALVDHALTVQRSADRIFSIIPDFISNCGMARVFAYLMNDKVVVDGPNILKDVEITIQRAMSNLLSAHRKDTGLLAGAYSAFMSGNSHA
jgi:glutamate dehydrogenase/leucine dehydrogenase